MIGAEDTAIENVGSQLGGFYLMVKLAWGRSFTNWDIPEDPFYGPLG